MSAGHGVVIMTMNHLMLMIIYYNDKAKYYKHDICDHDKIKHLFKGVDTVFHCAAEARIQPAIKNPLLAVKLIHMGTCSVLQAARDMGVRRVVYSSTSSAYGLINEVLKLKHNPMIVQILTLFQKSPAKSCVKCILICLVLKL